MQRSKRVVKKTEHVARGLSFLFCFTIVQLKVLESQLLRNQRMIVLEGIIHKQLIERDFLEDVHAQNLDYPTQTFVDSMNLIETGNHEVNAQGDPDLGAHGVLRCAEEGFDAQVLLDPFEEQFDLPTAFVYGCDSQGGQFEVIGGKDQPLAGLRIDIADTPKRFGIITFSLPSAQADSLVASKPGGFIDSSGLEHTELGIAFCADNKGCLCLLNAIQTCEIEIAPIKDVDASRFEGNLVEKMNIVNRSIANADEYRDWAAKVDLSMQFDRGFSPPKVCPWKHRKAQVDGRGIDGINHLFKIKSVGVIGIKSASFANENLTECFIHAPIPELVGISKIGSGDVATDTHGIALRAVSQTSFDIPQTLSKSDLRESHRKKLIAGWHPLAGSLHRVAVDAASQLLGIQHIGNLGEDESSAVHPLLRMNPCKGCQPVQMQDTPFSSLAA